MKLTQRILLEVFLTKKNTGWNSSHTAAMQSFGGYEPGLWVKSQVERPDKFD